MINLIPPPAKKSVLREYWVRAVTVWLILWSLTLLASAAILLPAHVLVGSQVTTYKASAIAASEQTEDYEAVTTSLRQASREARLVVDEADKMLLSELIARFEELQEGGLEITEIAISRSEDGIAPIAITGVAADRQTLASFRDRLLAEAVAETVDLPISNLASDRDIRFTITVTLANASGNNV